MQIISDSKQLRVCLEGSCEPKKVLLKNVYIYVLYVYIYICMYIYIFIMSLGRAHIATAKSRRALIANHQRFQTTSCLSRAGWSLSQKSLEKTCRTCEKQKKKYIYTHTCTHTHTQLHMQALSLFFLTHPHSTMQHAAAS